MTPPDQITAELADRPDEPHDDERIADGTALIINCAHLHNIAGPGCPYCPSRAA